MDSSLIFNVINNRFAFIASGQGHLEVIQWLIENGANASITNNAGENAKDVARRFAQLPAIRILGGDEGASAWVINYLISK